MASQLFCFFCKITNIGLLAFLCPAGPEIFQDEEGCILPRKWAISNKKWAISNNKWAVNKKNTANRQLVPKYCFLSDFDILNFIVFVRVKFH